MAFRVPKPRLFPIICMMLVVFGIGGVFVADAIAEYIDAGEEIINQIPEVEIYTAIGRESVYSSYDPVREQTATVKIEKELPMNSILYLYYKTEVGWLWEPFGSQYWAPVEVYVFDEANYTKWQTSGTAPSIAQSYDEVGQVYGIVPFNSTYYVVFDNSGEEFRNMQYKEVNWNVRCFIPEHTERIEEGSGLGDAIHYPFYGMIIIGTLGVTWWGYTDVYEKKRRKDNSGTSRDEEGRSSDEKSD